MVRKAGSAEQKRNNAGLISPPAISVSPAKFSLSLSHTVAPRTDTFVSAFGWFLLVVITNIRIFITII